MLDWLRPCSTTKVTPWLGSYGGECGLMFDTVTFAAPTKRGDDAGFARSIEYSETETSTTESWLIASQLKFNGTRPWRLRQY